MTKRRVKTWVLIAILLITMYLFMELSSIFNLINIVNNSTIDITKIVLLISCYELIKSLIKSLASRFSRQNKNKESR